MARCATCECWIGLFGRSYRRLGKLRHCKTCAPDAMRARYDATRQAVLADPPAHVVLAAGAISRDLDYPSNHRRYVGMLLLTEKGVIFAQVGEYKKAFEGAAAFGLIGAIGDMIAEKRRRQTASIGLEFVDRDNPLEAIHQADQLFLFPLAEIRKFKAGGSMCEIHRRKCKTPFKWLGPPRDLRMRRQLLNAYSKAVKTGQDIAEACLPLIAQTQTLP